VGIDRGIGLASRDVERLSFNGSIDVNRLPGHAAGDGGDASDDHRRTRQFVEGLLQRTQGRSKGAGRVDGHAA
jgi:hypothetical protein